MESMRALIDQLNELFDDEKANDSNKRSLSESLKFLGKSLTQDQALAKWANWTPVEGDPSKNSPYADFPHRVLLRWNSAGTPLSIVKTYTPGDDSMVLKFADGQVVVLHGDWRHSSSYIDHDGNRLGDQDGLEIGNIDIGWDRYAGDEMIAAAAVHLTTGARQSGATHRLASPPYLWGHEEKKLGRPLTVEEKSDFNTYVITLAELEWGTSPREP